MSDLKILAIGWVAALALGVGLAWKDGALPQQGLQEASPAPAKAVVDKPKTAKGKKNVEH